MKLEISRRAARRLHEIADYIHRENPSAALHVQRTIRAAFALLATYPDAGRACGRSCAASSCRSFRT
ncbi:type II toxin-antitoxin system RelE/ParE family toxin [Methylorubrum thiocyanatum]